MDQRDGTDVTRTARLGRKTRIVSTAAGLRFGLKFGTGGSGGNTLRRFLGEKG